MRRLVRLTDDDVTCLLRIFDKNNDGKIDYSEFALFVGQHHRANRTVRRGVASREKKKKSVAHKEASNRCRRAPVFHFVRENKRGTSGADRMAVLNHDADLARPSCAPKPSVGRAVVSHGESMGAALAESPV